jgi:hypothetical protein
MLQEVRDVGNLYAGFSEGFARQELVVLLLCFHMLDPRSTIVLLGDQQHTVVSTSTLLIKRFAHFLGVSLTAVLVLFSL